MRRAPLQVGECYRKEGMMREVVERDGHRVGYRHYVLGADGPETGGASGGYGFCSVSAFRAWGGELVPPDLTHRWRAAMSEARAEATRKAQPFADEVVRLVFRNAPPSQAIDGLLERDDLPARVRTLLEAARREIEGR